ncbi:phage holin family protein, partial [Fusicatenibacter saccharivorans]
MKQRIFTIISLTGGAVAAAFGDWDLALQTLILFMVIDLITGG